jgi:hypothetical protein
MAGLIGLTPVHHLSLAIRVASILWWLAIVVVLERQARRKRSAKRVWVRLAIIAGWVFVTATLINLDRIGMPRFRAVPNSAAVITMFVPLSLAAAGLLSWFIAAAVTQRWQAAAAYALAAVLAIVGCLTMLRIINPVTRLSHEADVRAMRWIGTHTPADAKFAVVVQPWIGGSYVGVDGGYWIPVLTNRRSILPPGLYTWVAPASDVDATNAVLQAWNGAVSWGGSSRARILAAGVRYAYFGPNSSASPLRAALRRSPNAAVIYSAGGAEVFALQ